MPKEIIERKNRTGFSMSMDMSLLKHDRNIDMILSSNITKELFNSDVDKKELINNDAVFKFLFCKKNTRRRGLY